MKGIRFYPDLRSEHANSSTRPLPPELEAKLDEQAKAAGKAREEIALGLLEEQLDGESLNGAALSAAEWVADIRAWANSHHQLSHEINDSRESIYAGRGE